MSRPTPLYFFMIVFVGIGLREAGIDGEVSFTFVRKVDSAWLISQMTRYQTVEHCVFS